MDADLSGDYNDGTKDVSMDPSPSQLAIIAEETALNTCLAVHAGPGSGKTFVLVRRVIYWIENGLLEPEQILVLSMTNKAVNLLRRRLAEALGPDMAARISIHTFHSFSLMLLDEYGEYYLPGFTLPVVVDDVSWKSFANLFLVPGVSGVKGKKLLARKLEEMLNNIRTQVMSVEEAEQTYGISKDMVVYIMNYLTQNGMMRYNDFISGAVNLMKISLESGDLVPKLKNYKAVVVDEFQDMLPPLMAIIDEVVQYPLEVDVNDLKHLTVVGDPNQCIYEFLGADPGALFNLKSLLPDGYIITERAIRETFRSTPEILDLASSVCIEPYSGSSESDQQPIVSVQQPLYPPIFCLERSYDYIGNEIARLICQLGGLLQPGDFAVLTRTNQNAEEVAELLKQLGFKYNLISAQQPWVSTNLHLLIDILRVINNGPGSDFGLMCILLVLDGQPRPHARVSKLFREYNKWQTQRGTMGANEFETYLLQMMEKPGQVLYKNKDSRNRMRAFLNEIGIARSVLKGDERPLQVFLCLYRVVESLGLRGFIVEDNTVITAEKGKPHLDLKSSLGAFFQVLCSYYNKYVEMKSSEECTRFPSFVSYYLRVNADPEVHFTPDKVNVSTVHSAKGLEFPVVFIVDYDRRKYHSYYYQHRNSSDWASLLSNRSRRWDDSSDTVSLQGANLLQEARVLYVAITRARFLVYFLTTSRVQAPNQFSTIAPVFNSDDNNNGCDLNNSINNNNTNSRLLLHTIADRLGRPFPSSGAIAQGRGIWEKWHARPYTTLAGGWFRCSQATQFEGKESLMESGLCQIIALCDKEPFRRTRAWEPHRVILLHWWCRRWCRIRM